MLEGTEAFIRELHEDMRAQLWGMRFVSFWGCVTMWATLQVSGTEMARADARLLELRPRAGISPIAFSLCRPRRLEL